MEYIDIHTLDFEAVTNPRELAHIKRHIAHFGRITDDMPVVVDGRRVIDGKRRCSALVQLLNEGERVDTQVPIVEVPASEAAPDPRIYGLARNANRSAGLVGQYDHVRSLHRDGWSVAQIARQSGMRRGEVRTLIQIAGLPEDIRQAAQDGRIAKTTLKRLARQAENDPGVLSWASRWLVDNPEERLTGKVLRSYAQATTRQAMAGLGLPGAAEFAERAPADPAVVAGLLRKAADLTNGDTKQQILGLIEALENGD